MKTCSHVDADGVACHLPYYAKGLCRPHYDAGRVKSGRKTKYADRPKVTCVSCLKLKVHHSNGKCVVCWHREDYRPFLTVEQRAKINKTQRTKYRKTHKIPKEKQRGPYKVYN